MSGCCWAISNWKHRLHYSNPLSKKKTCGFYLENTFSCKWNMKGIEPPSAFSILRYHTASKWNITPRETIWRRSSVPEALLEWDSNIGKTERSLTCTMQKSLKPFQCSMNHEKFQYWGKNSFYPSLSFPAVLWRWFHLFALCSAFVILFVCVVICHFHRASVARTTKYET